jgi:hypothetical protein
LLAPQPGEARCGAQFPELRILLLGNRNRFATAGLGTGAIAHCQEHLPSEPARLGLKQSILGLLRQPLRLREVWESRGQLHGHSARIPN